MSLPKCSLAAWLIVAGAALAAPATAAVLLANGAAGAGGLLGAPGLAGAALPVAALGWLALTAGLALYVLRPARSPATAAQGYAAYRTMLAMLALAQILVNLAGLAYALVAGPGRLANPTPGLLIVTVAALELTLLAILYLRIIRPGVLGWSELGLTGRAALRRLLEGLGAGLALILLAAALGLALREVGVDQTQIDRFAGIRGAPRWQYALILLAAAGLAPFVEESFFRGYVFTACRREKGAWPAYLFSAGLFAAAHFNLPALLPIFAIGLGLAFLRARTGSLLPGMAAHALNNALALSALYFAPSLPG